MKCIAGNDADLQYWYECEDCGTIVIVDNSNIKCLDKWECPTCNPFPWKYFTREQIEGDEGLKQLIDIHKEMGVI